MSTVTLKGERVHTFGKLPAVGSRAPGFRLVDARLQERTLEEFAGQKKLISIVPSLDTPVCAESARAFNQQAAGLEQVLVLVVSADLPFAQGRFCATEGLSRILTLSMMRSKEFAKQYGVLMTDGPLAGLAARAVLVLDEDDRVLHGELVEEITQEPNYQAALQALNAPADRTDRAAGKSSSETEQ